MKRKRMGFSTWHASPKGDPPPQPSPTRGEGVIRTNERAIKPSPLVGEGWVGGSPRRNPRARALILGALAVHLVASTASAETPASPSVGMPARIEQLVLPGAELEAIPIRDRDAPIVVRIAEAYRHGDGFRYDLIYYGLEPGEYDLRAMLRRKDGSGTGDLPPIPVQVRAILPPGQVEPHRLTPGESPALGGYRHVLISGAVAWSAGLAAILLLGRKRREAGLAAARKPPTLADRLRPLVESALAGKLGEGEHAELERLLIGYWRRRLAIEDVEPARALAILREHDDAGPLLKALEDWLHRPASSARRPVDMNALLAPYRGLPADALEGGPAAAGRAT